MKRPVFIGTMGGPKGGKTGFAASLFTSSRRDDKPILYIDNHGSTDHLDLPQWKKASRHGVMHVSSDDPGKVLDVLADVRRDRARGKTPYWAIVLDDYSEYALADMAERLEDLPEGKRIRAWGEHLDDASAIGRLHHPRVTGAHGIAIFRVAQMPDDKEAREKKVNADGDMKYSADTRRTFLKPFLQGKFGSWFPHQLDAIFYSYMEEVGKDLKFRMLLAPEGDIQVVSRWLGPFVADKRKQRWIENPTFDRVMEFIEAQSPQSVSDPVEQENKEEEA